MSLSRQSKQNKQTKHHIHQKHKSQTEKTAVANETNYALVWYAFYDHKVGKRSRRHSYNPGDCTGLHWPRL